MDPRVSVILPTFNERDNIGPLITRIGEALEESYEILVIEDDSPDRTWEVVEEFASRDSHIKLYRRMHERGLTSAIREGINRARGDIVVWMDCDLSMPPELIPRLIAQIPSCDLAIGSRYVAGGKDLGHSFLNSLGSRLLCLACSLFLNSGIKDYTSGFIAAKKDVVRDLGLKGDYGEYCIRLLYQAVRKGYRVMEIPYTLVPRISGQSKTATNPFGLLWRGRKYFYTLLELRFRGT